MRIDKAESVTFINRGSIRHDKPETDDIATVLNELFVLLEEYGPAWYTEEQRNRALHALLPTRRLAHCRRLAR